MVIVNEAPGHCYIKDELKCEIKIGKAELQNELNRFETQLEEIQSNPVQVVETTKAVKGGPEPLSGFCRNQKPIGDASNHRMTAVAGMRAIKSTRSVRGPFADPGHPRGSATGRELKQPVTMLSG